MGRISAKPYLPVDKLNILEKLIWIFRVDYFIVFLQSLRVSYLSFFCLCITHKNFNPKTKETLNGILRLQKAYKANFKQIANIDIKIVLMVYSNSPLEVLFRTYFTRWIPWKIIFLFLLTTKLKT